MNKFINLAILIFIANLPSHSFALNMKANRSICTPQNHNMLPGDSFTSVCSWDNLTTEEDVDAEITLTGKQTVHAECAFNGPDAMALVVGKKHAKMKMQVLPGNQFSFDVGYKNSEDTADENQNILFYLNTTSPKMGNTATCTFKVNEKN